MTRRIAIALACASALLVEWAAAGTARAQEEDGGSYAETAIPEPPAEGSADLAEDPQLFEASVHLEVARRHADEGQCELAIPRFRRVLQLDPLSASARLGLGACLHAVGRHAEAVPMLEGYFAVADPAVDPENAEIAARVLERARASSAALLVVVEPAGALVTVDGRPLLATSPGGGGERTMRIDPGRHVLRAELAGWTTEVAEIQVEAGERAWHLVHLDPRRAYLEVDTDPARALVVVDGRRVHGGEPIELAPGWHQLVVSAPDHTRRERDVVLADGEHLRVDVALAPAAREDHTLTDILAPVLGIAGGVIIGAIGLAVGLSN